jgi:hypothetical protein
LLEIRGAAEMIRVAVAHEHITDVVWIEARRAHLRQQHGFELVRVAGVDQENAGRRSQRPDYRAGAAERIQVVEHARRRDLGVVGTIRAARSTAEKLDGLAPFAAGDSACALDAGRRLGRIRGGACGGGRLCRGSSRERARQQRRACMSNHGSSLGHETTVRGARKIVRADRCHS